MQTITAGGVKGRLVKGMFHYGLANVISKFVGFLLIPIYTQYLTPEDYGIVELCGSFGAFVIILMRLGVPGSVTRFYFDHKDNEKELRDYVTTVHRILLISSLCIGTIALGLMFTFAENVLPGVLFFPFILLVIVNSTFSANSELQKRLLQSKEKSAYMATINILNVVLGIGLALFFVVVLKLGAVGLLLSQLGTTFFFFVQAQFFLKKYIKGIFRIEMMKASLKYGLGLLPHHLFAAFAPLLSKGILNYKESIAALGIFSLALRFVQPLDIMYHMFSQAFKPIYFSLRKSSEEQSIKNIFKIILAVAGILFSGSCLLLPSVVPILTPPRFHQTIVFIPILSLGFIGQVFYLMFASEAYFNKRTKYISVITAVGMSVNLILTFLLIDRIGAIGVAWANSAGFVTWALMAFLYSRESALNYFDGRSIAHVLLTVALSLFFSLYLSHDQYVFRFLIFLISFSGLAFLKGRVRREH